MNLRQLGCLISYPVAQLNNQPATLFSVTSGGCVGKWPKCAHRVHAYDLARLSTHPFLGKALHNSLVGLLCLSPLGRHLLNYSHCCNVAGRLCARSALYPTH